MSNDGGYPEQLRRELSAADERIAAGDLGTPLAEVMAELDAEEREL